MIKAFLVIVLSIVMPLLVLSQQSKDTIPPAKLVISDSTGKIMEKTPVTKVAAKAKDTLKMLDTDSLGKPKHSPRKAAIRSALIPGWGQIYNKKYWKVPIVGAAVGIPIYLVYYNKVWYDRTRYALKVTASGTTLPVFLDKVDPQLLPFVKANATTSLINYRNEFRRNMDYAVLFGLLFWGLNVIDATVDAHLKDFNVSDDLSLKIKPAVLPGNVAGVSFVFAIR
jgi:hypothetical protein